MRKIVLIVVLLALATTPAMGGRNINRAKAANASLPGKIMICNAVNRASDSIAV